MKIYSNNIWATNSSNRYTRFKNKKYKGEKKKKEVRRIHGLISKYQSINTKLIGIS
jgi:hypothetical protein